MVNGAKTSPDKPRYVVIGGGLAGLMTVIKIAEAGHDVDVFSLVPCRRSHSVCAQGGINGACACACPGPRPQGRSARERAPGPHRPPGR